MVGPRLGDGVVELVDVGLSDGDVELVGRLGGAVVEMLVGPRLVEELVVVEVFAKRLTA